MILIEQGGERMLVNSLDGHDDCKVLKRRVRKVPSDYHRLDASGNWKEDAEAKEHDRLKRLSRAELVAEIVAKVKG